MPFKFITIDDHHLNLCQITEFTYDGGYLRIWDTSRDNPNIIKDPDRVWYKYLCQAAGVDPA